MLIIDEAQNLSADVLEQLRLLTNLETNERKLLQIILIGQPELRTMLARPELEQLAQRVIARFHLEALSRGRDRAVHPAPPGGGRHDARDAVRPRARCSASTSSSRGVPRRINLLCDRALLGAYASGKTQVDARDRRQGGARGVRRAGRRHAADSGAPRSGALGLGAGAASALVGVRRRWIGVGASRAATAAASAAAATGAAAATAARPPRWRLPARRAASAARQAPLRPRRERAAAAAPVAGAGDAAVGRRRVARHADCRATRSDAWRELAPAWKRRRSATATRARRRSASSCTASAAQRQPAR